MDEIRLIVGIGFDGSTLPSGACRTVRGGRSDKWEEGCRRVAVLLTAAMRLLGKGMLDPVALKG